MMQVMSYTTEEEAFVDVCLEYASEPLEDGAVGRRATLPVHLRLLPSLQVVSVRFAEHHMPGDSKEDLTSKASVFRRSSSLGDLQLPAVSKLPGSTARSRSKKAAAQEDDVRTDEVGPAAAMPYADAGIMRCCLLEVEAVNCSDVVLQVTPAVPPCILTAPFTASPLWSMAQAH